MSKTKTVNGFVLRLKIFSLFFIVIMAGMLFFQTKELEAHERAHAQFCEYFGGEAVIEYKQEIKGFPFYTTGITTCYNDAGNPRDKAILDGVNEATSYPFNVILESIIFCTTILGSVLIFGK